MEILIPDIWFEFLAQKNTFWVLLSLICSFVILFKGADYFVSGSAGLATRLGVPHVIIGVTIVSLGTTSPEAAVSIMAAFAGKSGFAIGNAIGSVICNTALIFGLGCTMTVIPVDKFVIHRQGRAKVIATLAFVGFCYLSLWASIGSLSRIFGIILIAALVWYSHKSLKWAKQHHQTGIVDESILESAKTPFFLAIIFFIGLMMVIIGSRALIGSALQLCRIFGIPETIIAATVVAFGTAVPELATAVACILKGHRQLLLGNVIGANVLNLLLVIGASLTITKLQLPTMFYYLHLPALALIVVMFFAFAETSKKNFRRWYGPCFLMVFIAYVVIQYIA